MRAQVRSILSATAKFLLACFGCGLTSFTALCLINALDVWFTYHRFAVLGVELFGISAIDVAIAMLAVSMVASFPVLVAMALLRPIRQETCGRYMLLCGLLPLPALFIPQINGLPLLMAGACAGAGMFWWFAYRRPALGPTSGRRGAAIAWGITTVASVLILVAVWQEYSDMQARLAEPSQPHKAPDILSGTAQGDDILLLDDGGQLTLRKRGDWRPRLLPVKGVVAVRAADQATAFILSLSPNPYETLHNSVGQAGTLTLSRLHAGRLESFAPVAFEAIDMPGALAVNGSAPIIVSNHSLRILDLRTRTWRLVRLPGSESQQLMRGDVVAAVSNDGRTLFVGFNRGEWGGGMVAIDLASGTLRSLEARSSNELCAGPLNPECNPVTGLVPDPDNPPCVLASIGLSHMMTQGRIIRACPGRVDLVFEQPLERQSNRLARQIVGLFHSVRTPNIQTEPFFALVEGEKGSIWAVSPYSLYRREPFGWSYHPFPALTQHGDLSLGEGLSGVLLLSTTRNARFSLSGPTPLAIPAM